MNLRKAAEQALECLEYHWDNSESDLEHIPYVLETKKALIEALAQPDRKWVGVTREVKANWSSLGLVGVEIVEAHLKHINAP